MFNGTRLDRRFYCFGFGDNDGQPVYALIFSAANVIQLLLTIAFWLTILHTHNIYQAIASAVFMTFAGCFVFHLIPDHNAIPDDPEDEGLTEE